MTIEDEILSRRIRKDATAIICERRIGEWVTCQARHIIFCHQSMRSFVRPHTFRSSPSALQPCCQTCLESGRPKHASFFSLPCCSWRAVHCTTAREQSSPKNPAAVEGRVHQVHCLTAPKGRKGERAMHCSGRVQRTGVGLTAGECTSGVRFHISWLGNRKEEGKRDRRPWAEKKIAKSCLNFNSSMKMFLLYCTKE